METKVVELEVNSNLGTLKKQIKDANQELQKVSAEFGITSVQAIAAAKRVGELKDKMADLADLTKAFNPDAKFNALTGSIGGALDGFQALEGGMVLLGGNSEDLQKQMVKLQAVMAFSQGMQGLVESKDKLINLTSVVKDYASSLGKYMTTTKAMRVAEKELALAQEMTAGATKKKAIADAIATVSTTTLTGAQKLLRIALISTGIGAIVVAVGLLIANFDKVSLAVKTAYDKFNNLGLGVKIVIGIMFPFIGLIVGIGKALEYFGVIDDAETRNAKENAKAKTDAIEKENNRAIKSAQKKADANSSAMDFEIRKAEAMGKDTTKLEKKKAQDALASGRAILAMQKLKIDAYMEELKVLRASGDIDDERYKKIQGALVETQKAFKEQYNTNVSLRQDLEIMDITDKKKTTERQTKHNEKKVKTQKNEDNKEKEALAKLKEELLKIEDEYRVSLLSEQQKEENAVKVKYDELIANATKNKLDTTLIEKAKTAELLLIKEKYEKEAKESTEANELLKRETDKANLEVYLNTISDKTQREKNAIIKSEEEQKVLLRKAFDDKTITQAELDQALIDLKNETSVQLYDIDVATKEASEALEAEAYQKKMDNIMSYFDGAKQLSESLFAISEEQSQRELKSINKKYAALLKGAKGNAELTSKLEKQKNAEIEKEQRKAFNIKKKADTAGAIIDGAKAVTSILAQYPKFDGGFAMAAALIATAVTTGVAISKIQRTQFESTGGSADTAIASSAGNGATTVSAPNFNVVGQSGVNQISSLGQQPIQAYVVSGSVTTSQALDRARLDNATL
jgi:hypothetical protein